METPSRSSTLTLKYIGQVALILLLVLGAMFVNNTHLSIALLLWAYGCMMHFASSPQSLPYEK